MMSFRRLRSLPGIGALWVGLIVSISACGSDSTGPGNLDPKAALQSLALGMGRLAGTPTTAQLHAPFGALAPVLDQIEVTIDGTSHPMFAIGLRESFPAGTCTEDLLSSQIPPLPGTCTPVPPGLAVILWQSHSAFTRPDRLIVIVGEVGTTDFDFLASITSPTDPVFLAFAVYMEGEEVWGSLSGTLTSQVTATSQSCALPLPPYAKAGSCSIATFDEQGAIVFEPFSATIPSTRRLNLTIPRQTLHGFWQSITETQPAVIGAFSRTSRLLGF